MIPLHLDLGYYWRSKCTSIIKVWSELKIKDWQWGHLQWDSNTHPVFGDKIFLCTWYPSVSESVRGSGLLKHQKLPHECTVRKWLKTMEYCYGTSRNGMYINGHKHEDVCGVLMPLYPPSPHFSTLFLCLTLSSTPFTIPFRQNQKKVLCKTFISTNTLYYTCTTSILSVSSL